MLQINKCKSTLRLLQFWDSINSNSFFPNLFKTYNSCISVIRPLEILTIQLTIVLHSDWEMVIWIGKVKINEMTVIC